MRKLFYRILNAPHGYPEEQRYVVSAYRSLEFNSSIEKNYRFAATITEARSLIPQGALQLPFEPQYQFLELWETDDFAPSPIIFPQPCEEPSEDE